MKENKEEENYLVITQLFSLCVVLSIKKNKKKKLNEHICSQLF